MTSHVGPFYHCLGRDLAILCYCCLPLILGLEFTLNSSCRSTGLVSLSSTTGPQMHLLRVLPGLSLLGSQKLWESPISRQTEWEKPAKYCRWLLPYQALAIDIDKPGWHNRDRVSALIQLFSRQISGFLKSVAMPYNFIGTTDVYSALIYPALIYHRSMLREVAAWICCSYRATLTTCNISNIKILLCAHRIRVCLLQLIRCNIHCYIEPQSGMVSFRHAKTQIQPCFAIHPSPRVCYQVIDFSYPKLPCNSWCALCDFV